MSERWGGQVSFSIMWRPSSVRLHISLFSHLKNNHIIYIKFIRTGNLQKVPMDNFFPYSFLSLTSKVASREHRSIWLVERCKALFLIKTTVWMTLLPKWMVFTNITHHIISQRIIVVFDWLEYLYLQFILYFMQSPYVLLCLYASSWVL